MSNENLNNEEIVEETANDIIEESVEEVKKEIVVEDFEITMSMNMNYIVKRRVVSTFLDKKAKLRRRMPFR